MRMKVRAFCIGAVLLAAMWTVGCGHYVCGTTFGSSSCTASGSGISSSGGGGGGGNTISVTAFVYFVDPSAGEMAAEALNVNNSQTFAPLSSFVSPATSGGGGGGMVVVDKQYLYIAAPDSVLLGFSISSSGALTPVPNSPYAITGPSIAADPQGRFLFVGGPGIISAMTINSDGSLTAVPGSPFSTTGITPTQLVTDGLGKYLYAVGASTISEYSYNQTTGVLSVVAGSPLYTGMSEIASETTGKFILGITGAVNKLFVFAIGSTGGLTGVTGSPFSTQLAPINLAVSPNGAFVYTFNQSSFGTLATAQPMEGFSLNGAGALTALSGSPFTGLNAAVGVFDQSGQFLFTVAEVPNSNLQAAGEFAYAVDTSTGAVSSSLPNAGVVSETYAVTDAP
jgi:Lactonase, 7-bladed beta-propeller